MPGGGVPARRPRHVRRGQPRRSTSTSPPSRRSSSRSPSTRRSSTSPAPARCSATASTIAHRLRDDDPRRARPDVLGRRRHEQVPRQAGVGRGQAAGDARRRAARARACSRCAPGEELAYLHAAAGRAGCGASARRRWRACERMGVDHRRRPRRPRPAGRRSARSAGPTASTSSTSPTAATTGRSSPSATSSRSATRRRSPTTSTTSPTCAASWSASPTPWPPACARHGIGARTLTLKVRDGGVRDDHPGDDASAARSTPPTPSSRAVTPLLDHVDLAAGVRLLGVSASQVRRAGRAARLRRPASAAGPAGDRGRSARWSDASRAIDDVRERFGAAAIGPASSVATGAGRVAGGCASCARAPSSGVPTTRRDGAADRRATVARVEESPENMG